METRYNYERLYPDCQEINPLDDCLDIINDIVSKYDEIVYRAISGCPDLDPYEGVVVKTFEEVPLIYALILSSPVNNNELLANFANNVIKLRIKKREVSPLLYSRIEQCEDLIRDYYELPDMLESINEDELFPFELEIIKGYKKVGENLHAFLLRLEHKLSNYYCEAANAELASDLRELKEVCFYLLGKELLCQTEQ